MARFDLPEPPFGASHLSKQTDRANHIRLAGENPMFDFQDLFQWDRFITPTIIKTFYWLVIALICLFGIAGIFSGLAAMAISPFGGFIQLLSSIASVVVGVIFSRIAAEFVLIVFRINEHLGAIRDQGAGH
jgi:predicted membrane metal-binding protein